MLNVNRHIKTHSFFNKCFLFFLKSIFPFVFLGCVSNGYFIQNSILPVPETRKMVTAVIGKPRIVSLNGRELTSFYHDRKFDIVEDSKKIKTRYYTKVVILGPRRPYEISVQVVNERLDPETQTFVDMGLDEPLSQLKAVEIKKALNKGLENYQKLDGEIPF